MTKSLRESIKIVMLTLIATLALSGFAFGAVSQEEAAQLGKNLTPFGAEVAGNKDGTIPPYTGGLTKAPANYVAGSGFRPDPFVSEKPLFSITGQNMAQYASKLSIGTQGMLKKYSGFRIDVYKTHRTCAYPDYILKGSIKNATTTTTPPSGIGILNMSPGVPFPIPKTGAEIVMNHNLRFMGTSWISKSSTLVAEGNGSHYATGDPISVWNEYPQFNEDRNREDVKNQLYWKIRWIFESPVRKAGEGGQGIHHLVHDQDAIGPTHHLYLPGQRRVKLAPEVSFDTPCTDGAGTWTYDECWLFNGSMLRYNYKLIGKKELYVPYNTYRLTYYSGTPDNMIRPGSYINPDLIRWELHRVWVVELTLKPGKRHIYPKRTYYVDEDSWAILAADVYDGHGNIYKASFNNFSQNYDLGWPYSYSYMHYNLSNGQVGHGFYHRKENGSLKPMDPKPERWWSSDMLAGKGLR